MHGTYVKHVLQYGVLGVCRQKSEMFVNGTHKVLVNINSVGFYLKLCLVKVGVCGDAEGSGEIQFGEEGLAVVYPGYNRGRLRGIVISYIRAHTALQCTIASMGWQCILGAGVVQR